MAAAKTLLNAAGLLKDNKKLLKKSTATEHATSSSSTATEHATSSRLCEIPAAPVYAVVHGGHQKPPYFAIFLFLEST